LTIIIDLDMTLIYTTFVRPDENSSEYIRLNVNIKFKLIYNLER